MLYCSEGCQQRDSPSHQAVCATIKQYAARETELCHLPFTFAKETTDRMFHEHKAVDFLKRHGVYGRGLWRRESPLLHKTQTQRKCGYFTNREEDDQWILTEERSLLTSCPATPPPSPSAPLCDWQQYYVFRGLPLHSPVAAVLSCPLTLYFILTTCLRNDDPELFQRLVSGQTFVIHILGVEKEVEMKEAFLECARLLPGCRFHLVMIGKHLSKMVHGYCWEKDNLRLSVHRALYHDLQLPAPQIAVGFNAGLPAYPTWPPTLTKLMEQRTPAYFTDQSEYSCGCVSMAISSLGIPGVSPVIVNPFRSPLRIVTREQDMPWFPNAFLYRLLYESRGDLID
ncbi:zinc finger MYND domain-containing protein 15-like isoform X2 [Babylonia areolata]